MPNREDFDIIIGMDLIINGDFRIVNNQFDFIITQLK